MPLCLCSHYCHKQSVMSSCHYVASVNQARPVTPVGARLNRLGWPIPAQGFGFSALPSSGTTTLVTGARKKSFYTHFAPPHPWAMLTKHFHLTQVCILPFSNIEWGNGVVDTHSVGITITISCFGYFPTQLVHDCSTTVKLRTATRDNMATR